MPTSADPTRKFTRLRTEISRAFWCNPKHDFEFERATLRAVMRGDPERGTCWFDELFEGGIHLPAVEPDQTRALTILLSGPPGTGKSTLATEFCFRAATSTDIEPTGLLSLYVTLEAHKPWLIENACSFGWPDAESIFGEQTGRPPMVRVVPVRNESDLTQWHGQHPSPPANLISRLAELLGYRLSAVPNAGVAGIPTDDRDILVIDSLNTIQGDKLDLFNRLMSLVSSGPRIIILILDSFPQDGPRVWDFSADIVIRLDRDYSSGYLIRTIEVEKARYQPHVWGKHQLKIYEPYGRPEGALSQEDKIKYLRAHPYRRQGGVFIFPSIHYVLSRYKNRSPSTSPDPVPSPLQSLTDMLGGGLPRGRCVGLVGGRGTHKSHLGYMQVLSSLLGITLDSRQRIESNYDERALIVSLRDDEGMTRQTMAKIVKAQLPGSVDALAKLEADGRLEVTYYPPGFITPEEFFHRLLLSINRLKSGSERAHVTVLFNSLDQLSSRFPLCAEQDIFIPGIIQMLSAEGATSIFVAAHEANVGSTRGRDPGKSGANSDPEYYGLLSMAELIISLERKSFARLDYLRWIENSLRPKAGGHLSEDMFPSEIMAVELQVERFAGGQPAGARGILELIEDGELISQWCGSSGLIFAPCSEDDIRATVPPRKMRATKASRRSRAAASRK